MPELDKLSWIIYFAYEIFLLKIIILPVYFKKKRILTHLSDFEYQNPI